MLLIIMAPIPLIIIVRNSILLVDFVNQQMCEVMALDRAVSLRRVREPSLSF